MASPQIRDNRDAQRQECLLSKPFLFLFLLNNLLFSRGDDKLVFEEEGATKSQTKKQTLSGLIVWLDTRSLENH